MAKGDMTLRAVLKLAANDFTRGIGAIQKQLQGLGQYMRTAFAVGSVATFGREMVKWTRDFEDAMARAKAVSNASSEGFNMMRNEALKLGATTRYTSVQVANTLEVLTRNGLSATKATKVLADVLRLAQANAVELADAGNMITNTLNMFGLSVEKAAYVTDILSATAANSATDLTSLYEAMTNAAPMAHALSMDIEEVAAALGALANVGVKGPDAGTQLRQFLQRLTDPLAMKKMQKLTGFSFDEEFIDEKHLRGVLEKLQSLGLSVSQLNEIFTVRSSKSIIQLLNSMDNFIALLGVMERSEGTAFRMFTEGVGNMRYELDILKSMWQNLMVQLGSGTEGPFIGAVRYLQDFIRTFQNWGSAIAQLIPLLMVFHGKVFAFFKSMGAGAMAWARQTQIAEGIVRSERIKTSLEEKASVAGLSAAEKKYLKDRIAARKTIIASYKAEQRAAQALKATIATIGWAAAIMAVETIIVKVAAMNKELKEADKAYDDATKAADDFKTKVGVLKKLIGDGSDERSLVGALKAAIEMFPDFRDAILDAYTAAQKTEGGWKKFAATLEHIADLQGKIGKMNALNDRITGNVERMAVAFSKERTKFSGGQWQGYSNISSELYKAIKDLGYDDNKAMSVYRDIARIVITENMDNAIKQISNILDGWGIEKTTKEINSFINAARLGYETRDRNGRVIDRKDIGYTGGREAINELSQTQKETQEMEASVKFNTAIEKFNLGIEELKKTNKEGSAEFKEGAATLFETLKSSLKDLALNEEQKKLYKELETKYGKKGGSFSGGEEGGSGSKKKTPQDKFNDVIQDYIDDSKKVEAQYKNGIITQEQYRKALSDVELEALKTIASVDDLNTMLKGLPESSKQAGNSLAGMLKDFNQKAVENILLGFDQKQAEIKTKYENSPQNPDDLDAFNDSMDDLAAETMDELRKIQDLNDILDKLNPNMKDLYDLVKFGVDAKRETTRTNQLTKLNQDTKIDVKDPKVKAILSPDDKSIDGMKQKIQRELDEEDFAINIQMGNDETMLDATQDKIKEVEKAIEDLQSKIDSNDEGISLIKEEAVERLHTLKMYLMELMNQAKTMEDKVELSKLITKLNGEIKTLSTNTLDNISSMASAFDRLKDSVKDIAEVFDMDIEFEGLEKGITVINAIIQAIESVKEIMETFQAFQEMANKRQIRQNAEVALSNAAVAASEGIKASAVATGATVNAVETATSEASTTANKKRAKSNLMVAASETIKAGASGSAAAAEGAESVANIPYVGPILAVAAAASIAAALIAAFSKIKGFQNGGIVGGNSFYGDKNLIRANTGEMVINRGDQRTLFKAIKTGNFGGGGNVEFVIRGEQLVGTLNNYKRIHR